ncbi:hypothetical protein SAMD00019534_069860 [Acytostelium subglobosum LB1]|uniref:hypothetical protein n=1 Tax=Acytostelium subglobosum LB1 TaxID=1410327 RepID=UPI000644CB22|nr:hypothetical protein SAMD00019534_069860 [Acytostelium subglobosum LB1]GAM23811.1 hypothetical protein SAMD00019534_069860 [Acytostelium subglobosum LB1]|eukprot:XP_012753552.1 hypothetical protein SAMD00019534_069860 [Acytostelium subglobosum LB1]
MLSPLKVHIQVVEAKDLKKREFGKYDPYVEVRHLNSVRMTKVIKNNQSPVWNDSFDFNVDILNSPIILLVWDKEILFFGDNLIGCVVLELPKLRFEESAGIYSVDVWTPIQRLGKPDPVRGRLHVKLQCRNSMEILNDDWYLLGGDHDSDVCDKVYIGDDTSTTTCQETLRPPPSKKERALLDDSAPSSSCSTLLNDIGIDSSSRTLLISDHDMLSHCIICDRKDQPTNLFLMEECLHNICRRCLVGGIRQQLRSTDSNFTCIYKTCTFKLQPTLYKVSLCLC